MAKLKKSKTKKLNCFEKRSIPTSKISKYTGNSFNKKRFIRKNVN